MNSKYYSKNKILKYKKDDSKKENHHSFDHSSNMTTSKVKFQQTLYGEEYVKEYKPMTISKTPYKVLDAPQLKDDYYLNLLDWSAQDVLAVGLEKY